jgi:hypothetical protein
MKTLYTLALGVLLLGAARADVVWQAEPPTNVPASAQILQVLPTPVSQDTLRRQAAALGMPRDGKIVSTPVGLAVQVGDYLLQSNQFGSTFYCDGSVYLQRIPGVAPIPDTRAIGAAQEFLKAQFPRVLAEGQIVKVQHLMSQAQDIATGKLESPSQDESIVLLSRTINKIPVVGPGDMSRVHVGNDGGVTGIQNVWRNTRIIGVLIGLLKYDQVRDEFLKQLQAEMGDGSVRVFVNKIDFGYYSRPENQPQGFYQPCYLFTVSFFNEKLGQETGARLIPVPAIDPAQLKEPLELPQDDPKNGDPGRILLGDTKPPTLPATAPLVQIQRTEPSGDKMLSRLKLLGGVDGKLDQNPRGLVAADGTSNTVLFEDTTGGEFFGHMDRFLLEKPGEEKPIADGTAMRVAEAWLEKLGDMDPQQLGLPAVQHLFHQSYDIDKKTDNPPTQDETIVTFTRQIPNPKGDVPIPLVGQGTGIEVHVDNGGNVTGHHRVWRNLTPTTQMVELLPYDQLQEAFLRQLTPELGDYVAKVTDIKFGYFSRPEGYEQGWLLPAVLYEVDLINPDTGLVTAHRQIPVPASANQPEDLEDPAAAVQPEVADGSRDADSVPQLYGDIDGDGAVTTMDAALAMKMFGGMADSFIPPAQFTAGDVAPQGAPDGRIAMNDSLRILRSIFQLDDISNGP